MSSDEKSGTLTAEAIRGALDALWNNPAFHGRPAIPDPWGYKRMRATWPKSRIFCGALLFAPDESLVNAIRTELAMTETPVHPLEAAWLNSPVQGPVPLGCTRPPHPDSPYHWDGRGTWWR